MAKEWPLSQSPLVVPYACQRYRYIPVALPVCYLPPCLSFLPCGATPVLHAVSSPVAVLPCVTRNGQNLEGDNSGGRGFTGT